MKRILILLLSALIGPLFVAGLANSAQSPPVSGTPHVIDGRTLSIGDRRFVLFGIDVPALGQTCERFGRSYPCGVVARTALMDLVAGVKVTCRPVRGQRARLVQQIKPAIANVALCQATSVDLSWNMVHTGWALAAPGYGKRYYGAIEAAARKRRSGLWKGAFVKPWVWRQRHSKK